MQAHLEIHDPDDGDAENNYVGYEVGDTGAQPARALLRAMAQIGSVCGRYWRTRSQIISDGAD